MKKVLLVIYSLTILSLLPAVVTVFAWGSGLSDLVIFLGWFALVVANGVALKSPRWAAALGIVAAGALWSQLADSIGGFLLFEPHNRALYGVLLGPGLLVLASVWASLKVLVSMRLVSARSSAVALATVIVLVALVPTAFAHRSYPENLFAEFDFSKPGGPVIMTVRPAPGDTRMFRVPLDSDEVIAHIRSEARTVGGTPYFSNARFKVLYRFNRLERVTLVGFEGWRARSRPSWRAEDLDGITSFLTPYS